MKKNISADEFKKKTFYYAPWNLREYWFYLDGNNSVLINRLSKRISVNFNISESEVIKIIQSTPLPKSELDEASVYDKRDLIERIFDAMDVKIEQ